MNKKEELCKIIMETDFSNKDSLSSKERVEIMGKLTSILWEAYQKDREDFHKKVVEENPEQYKDSDGCDIVFTPKEVRENILRVYQNYHYVLKYGCDGNLDTMADTIKLLHNELLKSCIMGGVIYENTWQEIL